MALKVRKIFYIFFSGILIMILSILYYYAFNSDEKRPGISLNMIKRSKRITSVQYEAVNESFNGNGERSISTSIITYVYPDKLRIETIRDTKTIEIYNNDRYMYYYTSQEKVEIKECFPPEEPYMTELEKKVEDIYKSGNYEFFGYEEKEDKKLEVIGVKSRDDGHSYMHKLWITYINEVKLPCIEEYFIDNKVVSKTKYTFYKVNEPINPDLFQMPLSSQTKIIEDGFLPKHVETFKEAQKYLNFNLLLPETTPIDLIISEITVIPPIKHPSFSCIYLKDGYRVYISEKKENEKLTANSRLGEMKSEFYVEDEKVVIRWFQDGILVNLSGDVELIEDIIYLAESISGGKLIRDEMKNKSGYRGEIIWSIS